MPRIFISYRREDSADVTGRIHDRLATHFGDEAVFEDVADIPFGVDFKDHLNSVLAECSVVLVIIGRDWVRITDSEGNRRLDDPTDFVRIEVESALERDIPVVPVLVRGATMPSKDELPESLAELPHRNAIPVRHDPDFHNDMDRLIEGLERQLGAEAGFPSAPAPIPTPSKPKTTARRGLPTWAWIGGIMGGVALVAGALAVLVIFKGCVPGTPGESAPAPPSCASDDETVTDNADWAPVTQDFGGVQMACVPGGCFRMGSSQQEINFADGLCETYYGQSLERFENEAPRHEICFEEPFWIDVYEVTNAEFAAFLNSRGNQTEGGVTWLNAGALNARIHDSGGRWAADSGYEGHPAIEITWYGAAAYCQWRGARLPTEAEWEYAARGPDELVFPWGDTFESARLNHCDSNCERGWANTNVDDGYPNTAPVGSYPGGVSWVGAYDMSGNVIEWVADWYDEDYYSILSAPAVDPQGPSSGNERVLRGGSWAMHASLLRGAFRERDRPDDSSSFRGFRCARSYSD